MLGIPTDVVDATEHLLQLADEPRRARDRPRQRERPLLRLLERRRASTPRPTRWVDERHAREGARPAYLSFTLRGDRRFLRGYRGRPPRLVARGATASASRASARFVQNSRPVHLLPLGRCTSARTSRSTAARISLRGHEARRPCATRPARSWRLFRDGATASRDHPQARELHAASREARIDRARRGGRQPTAASRSRSTATTIGEYTDESRSSRGATVARARRRSQADVATDAACRRLGRLAAGHDAVGVEHRVDVAQARDAVLERGRVRRPRRRSGS